jgi:UDP-glucuronate 4-epimerase
MKKILITGVAGFVGFHLIKRLVNNHNFSLFGIDNINQYYDINLKLARLQELGILSSPKDHITVQSSKYNNFSFVKCDITDIKKIEEVFNYFKPDIVINLAAQAGVRFSIDSPKSYIDSNVVGFHTILDFCAKFKVKKLIYASSSSVYGDSNILPYLENQCVQKPVSLYAATKITNELFANVYSQLYGLNTIGLRFFTVYGPYGRPDMAYYKFTKSIIESKEISIFNNGLLSRDFTYIDDVVESIYLLLNDELKFEKLNNIFNIGNSAPINLLDFVKTLEEIIGKKAKLRYVGMQPGDVHDTYSDSNLLSNLISFTPNTKISDGLKLFVNWYKSYYSSQNNKK